jgi:hypothetical protein
VDGHGTIARSLRDSRTFHYTPLIGNAASEYT